MIKLLKDILSNNISEEDKVHTKNLELLSGLMIEAAYTDGQIDEIEINKIKLTLINVFEKIFYIARQKLKNGPFLESPDLMNPIGCNSNQLKDIMVFCGYQYVTISDEKKLFFINSNKKEVKKSVKTNKNKKISRKKNNKDPNSPFAVLEKLL